jgi:hypothetical protein
VSAGVVVRGEGFSAACEAPPFLPAEHEKQKGLVAIRN